MLSFRAKISVNLAMVFASAAVLAGFLLTYNHDYRWIGHLIAGLVTIFLLIGTFVAGSALAGRSRKPPSRNTFRLHRKLGIALGFASAATFFYGLLVMLPQEKRLLDTMHGRFGLIIVLLSLSQIVPSLFLKNRKSMRLIHRWNGYILAFFIGFQLVFGVIALPVFTTLPSVDRVLLPKVAPMEVVWHPDGVISSGEYYASRIVDNGNYEIQYRGDGRYIYIGIRARTTGWVGVGIETGEGMLGAGMVFGYVSAGKVTVHDSFGIGRFKHLPDTRLGGTDDIVEFGGKEEDGFTIIEFKLPMITGDKYDIPLVEGVHRVIWAYGRDDTPEMHVARGHIEIDLNSK